MLAPHFQGNESAYFTGTYSDDYGFPHGLMAVRNVVKDWRSFLKGLGFDGEWMLGVEKHQYRDILHVHAIVSGPYSQEDRERLRGWWAVDRGHARVLPVLDGCASYVTKYALKGDCEGFEWFFRKDEASGGQPERLAPIGSAFEIISVFEGVGE